MLTSQTAIIARDWSNWFAEWLIVFILIAEFYYDKHKDDLKKQKKTKTTKKTTTQPGGATITEETQETVEPAKENGNGIS